MALERHEKALAGLRAGLVDLEVSPSYLMLTNDSLEGETKRKVGSATERALELWPLLNAVSAALSHVRGYADENGTRGRHRDELVRLLGEAWVEVEFDSGGSTTTERMGIADILARFRRGYDEVAGWADTINGLWLDLLPRLDSARKTLLRLQAEADALDVPEPLIGRALALVEDLEERLVADPLGVVPGDGPQLDEAVARAAEQVAVLRSGHDSLEADLRSTEQLLASLRVLRARAEAAAAGSRTKVAEVDAEGLVRVPSASILDGPSGLADSLDQLFDNSADTSWNQRRTLLDSWLSTARKLERQLIKAEEANRRPLLQRDELRGRLRAYQAKISAVGKAEDLELTTIVDRARSTLYTSPTDLAEAAAAIDELARRLRS